MARIYYYVIFAIIISILIEIAGLQIIGQGGLLDTVGLFDIENGTVTFDSIFFAQILIVLSLVVGAGLVIGLFTRLNENFLLATFIVAILSVTFVGALWNVIVISNNYQNYIRIPILIVMAPFTVGYMLSLFEYIRGNI